ncbi:hypothetical protein K523DRAFT_34609 [Schizophyllum commune Tattone D]|nr:hypothetical protein K523DRAFT_34609 [Schizophyllum commune Tattone D]
MQEGVQVRESEEGGGRKGGGGRATPELLVVEGAKWKGRGRREGAGWKGGRRSLAGTNQAFARARRRRGVVGMCVTSKLNGKMCTFGNALVAERVRSGPSSHDPQPSPLLWLLRPSHTLFPLLPSSHTFPHLTTLSLPRFSGPFGPLTSCSHSSLFDPPLLRRAPTPRSVGRGGGRSRMSGVRGEGVVWNGGRGRGWRACARM